MRISLKVSAAFVFFVMIIINAMLYLQHYQKTHFNCVGDILTFNGSVKLDTKISMSLAGDVGHLIVDGIVSNKTEYVSTTRLITSFKFKLRGNEIYTTNHSVSALMGNTTSSETQKTFLPNNMFFNNTSSRKKIYSLSNDRYIVTRDSYILFYCAAR